MKFLINRAKAPDSSYLRRAGRPFSSLIISSVMMFTLSMNTYAKKDVVQCGNLIFAGNNTSRCFSDEFLSSVQKKTSIATARRFKSVKLSSDELFKIPFVIMTGEADFHLSGKESKNLKSYLSSGGFMLVSAGCSSKKFSNAFKREIKRIFGKNKLTPIPLSHVIFRTVYKIDKLELAHADGALKAELFGLKLNGKTVLVFSPHGLNDTGNTKGCCCCGGNEIGNSIKVNVNILAYALIH
jgi:Domain of unknown function (DUF4159)